MSLVPTQQILDMESLLPRKSLTALKMFNSRTNLVTNKTLKGVSVTLSDLPEFYLQKLKKSLQLSYK